MPPCWFHCTKQSDFCDCNCSGWESWGMVLPACKWINRHIAAFEFQLLPRQPYFLGPPTTTTYSVVSPYYWSITAIGAHPLVQVCLSLRCPIICTCDFLIDFCHIKHRWSNFFGCMKKYGTFDCKSPQWSLAFCTYFGSKVKQRLQQTQIRVVENLSLNSLSY